MAIVYVLSRLQVVQISYQEIWIGIIVCVKNLFPVINR